MGLVIVQTVNAILCKIRDSTEVVIRLVSPKSGIAQKTCDHHWDGGRETRLKETYTEY